MSRTVLGASLLLLFMGGACVEVDEPTWSAANGPGSEKDSWKGGGRAPPREAKDFTIYVDGTAARGLVAYPRGQPTHLVVCAHGMGHTVESWRAHLERIAANGAIAVAMDYAPYFDLDRGGAETVAAARYFQARFPSIETTHLFSVSMGSAAGGLGLSESSGVFDNWINVEGLTNLVETYAAAKAVGHRAANDIEVDTGGTPLTATAEYQRRSTALRPADLADHGLEGVTFIHSINDGLVPYDQARELSDGLAGLGVEWDFHTVLRGPCAEQGTTGTGQLGLFNPLCLAGHASEKSSTHPVMVRAFEVLFASMRGEHGYDGHRELVVDEPGQ